MYMIREVDLARAGRRRSGAAAYHRFGFRRSGMPLARVYIAVRRHFHLLSSVLVGIRRLRMLRLMMR